jgi:ATP-dependent helicase HrpA
MSFYQQLEAQLAQVMQGDRHRLRNQLRAIQQAEQEGRPFDDRLNRLQTELDKSLVIAEKRASQVPQLEYDETLPVVLRKDDIAAAIRAHPVVVVCGETGSGKSTQLPKICLECGRGVTGLIGHTQPRRIAARAIAARLAEELQSSVGGRVGFKIRFADQTSPETLIKVMTDGVLLAESQQDRFFDQYDTLIIDEAHERSLNIDFLLGYLKRLLARRENLKLIITSATIDAERFAAHFGDGHTPAPIIEVSGRTYPVEVLYRPLESETGEQDDLDITQGVLQAVDELSRHGPGDMLVFFAHRAGNSRSLAQTPRPGLGRNRNPAALRPPFHAGTKPRLSLAQRAANRAGHQRRRVVAHRSGHSLCHRHRHGPHQSLFGPQQTPAPADRTGRAGFRRSAQRALRPDWAWRLYSLYSEDDFLRRDRFTAPEIQRTNLAAVLLQTLALQLGPLEEFPFLDPPKPESIRDGYKTLFELGALDDRRELTPIGRQMARLPADPRIARMLLAGSAEGCLADVLVIAAALETQDPRERPVDRQSDADAVHAKFQFGDSDFISLLRMWDFYHHLKADLSKNQFKRACKQNYLSELRLREWSDVHRQLLDMATQAGLNVSRRRWTTAADAQARADTAASEKTGNPAVRSTEQAQAGVARADRQSLRELGGGAYGAIHRAILTGLLSNVAVRGETAEYHAAGGNKVFLWPGSAIMGSKPKWIVAAEMVETTRRYARTAARIDPDWIEPLATHVVNRHYSDPQWDRRGGGAMAQERVTLFGLTIVPRRRVRYGPIDPAASRELLIRCGLVEGDIECRAPFYRHNQRVREELAGLAARTRDRKYLVEDQVVYDFYDARLPRDIYDLHRLEKWRPGAEKQKPRLLMMEHADLLGGACEPPTEEEYPQQLPIDRMQLPLSYHFEPGDQRDGVTLTVPREALFQLSAERLGWLIPGFLAEKIEHLIRALPKQQRRNLIPAPEVARRVARKLHFAKASFMPQVAAALAAEAGESISPRAI